MNLLLDTHVWLWTLSDPSRLSSDISALITSQDNEVWVSSVSLWEVNIKTQIGKLAVQGDLIEATESQELRFLSFSKEHAEKIRSLPLHHKDPFDRALIAQAICQKLKLVTADTALRDYSELVEMIIVDKN